jgi:hypothetical protein
VCAAGLPEAVLRTEGCGRYPLHRGVRRGRPVCFHGRAAVWCAFSGALSKRARKRPKERPRKGTVEQRVAADECIATTDALAAERGVLSSERRNTSAMIRPFGVGGRHGASVVGERATAEPS